MEKLGGSKQRNDSILVMFNRERFLYYLLAGVIGWQAILFSYGVAQCMSVTPKSEMHNICPQLGDRFETFTSTTLGAVLGLIGGAAALNAAFPQKPSSRGPQTPQTPPAPPLAQPSMGPNRRKD